MKRWRACSRGTGTHDLGAASLSLKLVRPSPRLSGFVLAQGMNMQPAARKDTWAAGDLYEAYMGRWSRVAGREFMDWLGQPPGLDWLDVGCGTGALVRTIVDHCAPRSVEGIDASPAFIEHARSSMRGVRARFEVGDAQSLPLSAATVDVAVSALVINFLPQPARAVAQMARVVRPRGTVAVYVWDYTGRMDMMRHFWDAAGELDAAARELDEARRFPDCRPETLRDLFGAAGLRDIAVRPIDIATHFRDFDDYWGPFLGGQGPAPGYAMSLSEPRRNALRDLIRARLPVAEDGSIPLVARAWAARGQAA